MLFTVLMTATNEQLSPYHSERGNGDLSVTLIVNLDPFRDSKAKL